MSYPNRRVDCSQVVRSENAPYAVAADGPATKITAGKGANPSRLRTRVKLRTGVLSHHSGRAGPQNTDLREHVVVLPRKVLVARAAVQVRPGEDLRR